MILKNFLTIGFVLTVLVACGGDNGSSVTNSDEDSSSAVCEDCDGSSSSKAKSSSSFSVTPQSSERETSVSSSSSAKSSSSEKKTESSSSMTSSLSSSVDSSSSGTGESSSSSGGLSSSSSTESSSSVASSSSSAESSSSSVASCSSGAQSSSSVAYVDPSTVVKGSMTDERDGQTYKTVKIGTQTWMAENLNYAYTGVPYNYQDYGPFAPDSFSTSDSTSWCYDNDPANCSKCFSDIPSDCYKYGRLYTWAAAMDSVGLWTANGKECGLGKTCLPTYPVRGICPEGWHLPDSTEWNMLFTAVGGLSKANTMLRSDGDWFRSGNGLNLYSFTALPVGSRDEYGFGSESYNAYFWSSSEYNSSHACKLTLWHDQSNANLYFGSKYNGFSVRCLKDLQAE